MWVRCALGVVIAMYVHGFAAAGNGAAENGAAENGAAENGAAENGAAENGAAGNGAAEPVVGEPGSLAAGRRATRDALMLAPGRVDVSVTLEMSMSTRALGQPVSLAPDLYVGVTPDVTVGLVHSGRALGLLDSGWGLCFTGADDGCEPVYSGTGVDGLFLFLRARGLELAARTRLYAARFADPLKLRVTLGILGGYRLGWLSVRFDPHISLGLVNRELGNAHALNVPVEVFFALGCHADMYVRTGVHGLVRGFDEQYAVPVGLGVRVRPGARWQVGAQYALRQILGPLNTYKPRDLIVFVDYQFEDVF